MLSGLRKRGDGDYRLRQHTHAPPLNSRILHDVLFLQSNSSGNVHTERVLTARVCKALSEGLAPLPAVGLAGYDCQLQFYSWNANDPHTQNLN